MPRTELRSEVEINVPLAHVYAVLNDFARYLLKPRVTQVTENGELRWQGGFLFPFLLQAEHFFLLSERAAGVTRVVQGQNFSGFLLRFSGNALTLAARGSVYLNQALKKRAESTR